MNKFRQTACRDVQALARTLVFSVSADFKVVSTRAEVRAVKWAVVVEAFIQSDVMSEVNPVISSRLFPLFVAFFSEVPDWLRVIRLAACHAQHSFNLGRERVRVHRSGVHP